MQSVSTIGSNAFENTKWLNEQRKANPLVIVNNILIDSSTASGDIVIPDTVKIIGSSSFYNNSELTSVSIPDSVTEIQGDAFFNCSSMSSITIPENVSFIGWYAIGYCYDDSAIYEKLQENFKVYCFAHSEKQLGAVKFKWENVLGNSHYGTAGYVNGKWKLLDSVSADDFYSYPLP